MSKIKLEEIQILLKEKNWKLISTEYKNLDTEMIFECPEGHRVYAPWKKMRGALICPVCEANDFKVKDQKIIPKKKNQKRFLALDQATKVTGWAIFDGQQLIKYGKFETNYEDEIARDHDIKNWFISMINTWQPDCIGIEGIQLQEKSEERRMGVTVFETLARLQGILMETAYSLGIKYKICPTNTWRAHCGVKGQKRTDKKKSMQLLAKKWYDVTLVDDEADAIGIGKYISDTSGKEIKIENWE